MAVTPELRRRIAAAAAAVARTVGYTNAGTIEFLLDEDGSFYFLEMNTRLQVEHPVTEMVTSVDLVQWQIRIARGEKLDIDPERAFTPHGHAIECRIYAEDPDQGFMPSPGLIQGLRPGLGPGDARRRRRERRVHRAGVLRLDDREARRVGRLAAAKPIARMARALREYQVLGIRTTIPFFLWLMRQPDYVRRPVRHDLPRSTARGRATASPSASSRRATRNWRRWRRRWTRICERTRGPAWRGRTARSRPGSRPRGARRCADDVRNRHQRPHAHRLGRTCGSRPVPRRRRRHASTTSMRRASAASACRCCSRGTAA